MRILIDWETELPKRLVETADGCLEFPGTHGKHAKPGWVSAPDPYAHRMAWILANGEIPEGKYVCHHCDNPPCCNPDHLYIGTQVENMRDASERHPYFNKTHCALCGVEYPPERPPGKHPRCLPCNRVGWHRRKAARQH